MLKSSAVSLATFCLLLLMPAALQAQPSGGPYGPIQQRYVVPEGAAHVYYVAPDGKVEAAGTSLSEPTSIESAIERAVTGDAIILRGGTYRTGDLRFNQQITMQPYEDERPILKGTRVATDWQRLRGNLWVTNWETLYPMKPQDWWQREREATRTPLHRFNNDMVFVDGKMLLSAGWAGDVDEKSYWIDYEQGKVYIGVNPKGKTVEITAFDSALTRTTRDVHGKTSDGKGPTVRGITFTQYAYRAIEIEGEDPEGVSPESEHGKDVVGSTFEHCEISHCSRVAGYFRGDGLTIRHCLVSDTSTEGIFILSSNDVLLEKNVITRNNTEGITGYYNSAVKIFNQCYRVTCRDNLVIDNPDSSGIWYDVGNVDGVVVNNWVERTYNGFFYEISQRAICAGNVFVDCDSGVRVLNSADVQVYQNTLINSRASFERTTRSAVNDHFGWHPSTGPDVDERDGHVFVGNLLAADEGFRGPLMMTFQVRPLNKTLTEPQLTTLDYNVYVRQDKPGAQPLIAWSPADTEAGEREFPPGGMMANWESFGASRNTKQLGSPSELHAMIPQFSANSRAFLGYYGPLFRGVRLSRYDLEADFPGTRSAAPLSDDVLELLGQSRESAQFPGAFPVTPE